MKGYRTLWQNQPKPQSPIKTISQLLADYDVSPMAMLEWVWSEPSLRQELVERSRRDVLSQFGKVGNAARNAKLTDAERSASARHAARCRRNSVVVQEVGDN
jgi:hypothetical protein